MSALSALATVLRLERPMAFLDLETTGVNIQEDRIVEIGILRIGPSGAVETWETLVHPGRPIPPEATAVHGITDAMVAEAPPFAAIAETVDRWLEGCDLGGFNARKFDRPLLEAEFARAGRRPPSPSARLVDPFLIFLRQEPRDLAAGLTFYCGEDPEIPEAAGGRAHRALWDAAATAHILLGQLARYTDLPRELDALVEFCEHRDPSWLDRDGKIAWRNGEACLTFGKYAGRSLRELAATERSFLGWILTKDFSSDTKRLVSDALNGRFPVKPAEAI